MRVKHYKKLQQFIIVFFTISIFCSCGEENDIGFTNGNNPIKQTQIPGEIDLTFGTDGIVITEFSGYYDVPKKIISQNDGSILVAGESFDGENSNLVVSHYNSSGELDENYGNNGKGTAFITVGVAYTSLSGAVQQQDGKILLAGYSYNGHDNDIVLVRLSTEGELDSSFGVEGIYRSPAGTNECALSIALQKDGKILIGGFTENEIDNDLDFLIVRYTADGMIDSSFGAEGYVKTPLPSDSGYRRIGEFTALAISGDGSIIAAGLSSIEYQTFTTRELAIARYTPMGFIDVDFGTPDLTVEIPANWPRDMLIKENNKTIIAASEFNLGTNSDNFSLLQFDENGLVDLSFGVSGTALSEIGDGYAFISSLAMDSNGKLIAVGDTLQDGQYSFALARFNTNGTIDSTFGEEGIVITKVGIESSNATSVAIQPDGKILVTGSVKTEGSISAFGIVRYYP